MVGMDGFVTHSAVGSRNPSGGTDMATEERTSVGISEFRATVRRELWWQTTILFFGVFSMMLMWVLVVALARST